MQDSHSVFENDYTIHPIQNKPDTGSYRLMLAILQYALMELASGTPRVRRDAELWFASDDTNHPYSSSSVCEELGIDKRSLIKQILALPVQGRKEIVSRLTKRTAGARHKIVDYSSRQGRYDEQED